MGNGPPKSTPARLIRDPRGKRFYFVFQEENNQKQPYESANPSEKSTEIIGWYAGKEIVRLRKPSSR